MSDPIALERRLRKLEATLEALAARERGTSTGTVTSVGLTMPTAVFDVAGSPITGSGTLAVTFDTQTANRVFSGPTSGAAAAPTFRDLVQADIPLDTGEVGYGDVNNKLTSNSGLVYSGGTAILTADGGYRSLEQATPTTPSAGSGLIFIGNSGVNNGVASSVDDAGTVYQMLRYADTTYTPTYGGLTTSGTTTYTTQQGNYLRIGSLIVTQFEVTWTAATGTGVAFISLPFTARATLEFAMPIYPSNITYAGGPPYALVNTGTNYLVLGTPTSNAATATLAVEAAGTVFGTAIFFI